MDFAFSESAFSQTDGVGLNQVTDIYDFADILSGFNDVEFEGCPDCSATLERAQNLQCAYNEQVVETDTLMGLLDSLETEVIRSRKDAVRRAEGINRLRTKVNAMQFIEHYRTICCDVISIIYGLVWKEVKKRQPAALKSTFFDAIDDGDAVAAQVLQESVSALGMTGAEYEALVLMKGGRCKRYHTDISPPDAVKFLQHRPTPDNFQFVKEVLLKTKAKWAVVSSVVS